MMTFALSAQPRPVTCRHWRTTESRPRSGCGSIGRGTRIAREFAGFSPAPRSKPRRFHCLQVWPNAMQCAVGLWFRC